MGEIGRKLKIRVGLVTVEAQGYDTNALRSALLQCLDESIKRKKVAKLVWEITASDTFISDKIFTKEILIATIDYSKFKFIFKDSKPKREKKQIINPDFFGAWADVIKNI